MLQKLLCLKVQSRNQSKIVIGTQTESDAERMIGGMIGSRRILMCAYPSLFAYLKLRTFLYFNSVFEPLYVITNFL